MVVPRSRTERYGPPCSFQVVAPHIWNTLPSHLKNRNISREQFKSALIHGSLCKPLSGGASLRTFA